MIANLKIGPCPKCGSTTFHATAHATQTWLVDEDGEFIKAETNCDELTPPTIEIVGFLGGAARFIAKPCLKQRVMRFPIIRYRRSA